MPRSVVTAPADPPRSASPTLTTSALCAAAGVTRGVLRLYEREGLIAWPLRQLGLISDPECSFLFDFLLAAQAGNPPVTPAAHVPLRKPAAPSVAGRRE